MGVCHLSAVYPLTAICAGNPFFQLVECLRGEVPDRPNWVGIIGHANRHLVGPELFRSIERARLGSVVEPEAFDYLASMNEANDERNARLGAQLDEFLAQMVRDDIDCCLIKGSVELCRASRTQDVARMIFDIDVLIDAADEARVNCALADLGYRISEGSQSDYSTGRFIRDDVVGAIDVHKTMPERFLGVISDEELRAQTSIVQGFGQNVRTPDIGLRLAINVAHEMMHDRGVFTGFVNLRYLLELSRFLAAGRDSIDWSRISAKCENDRMKLGYELQSRMLTALLPPASFPFVKPTRMGAFLHRRRVAKAMFPNLGDLEWRAVRSIRKLL